jgi:hypothetical protein
MNTFMSNPFAQLPLDQTAIDIHSRYEIPGAAEHVIKERDKTRDNRTRPGNANMTHTNAAREESKTNTIQNQNIWSQDTPAEEQSDSNGDSTGTTEGRRRVGYTPQTDFRQCSEPSFRAGEKDSC